MAVQDESSSKLKKIFDQNVEITGNLTIGGSVSGISTDNFYLDGITKSGNTLTFSVNGATNQTYTFGSNAFTSYTDHSTQGYLTSVPDITLLSGLNDYVWDASTNGRDFNLGIQTSFVSAGQGYPQFGSVVRIATYTGINDGGTAEMYFPYSATYGGSSMRYRLGKYNNAGWTGWKTVIDSDNIGSQSVANADTVDSKHATDFNLQYVTDNNATTSNPISIYDNASSANPRLSLGRGSGERLKFDVEDRVARITHQQDEGTGGHELWFTIDSPTTSTTSKIFYWAERAADGSSSNTLMDLNSSRLNVPNNLTAGTISSSGTITSNRNYINNGAVWSETTQGLGIGSIHIDPASTTDHAGGAITFGASDVADGTNAQAGIYVRSDGSYGTKMYFSTTDSYATGSKTAMSIDQYGLVTINPRLDSAKSFRVYYDMDVYNTVNFTDDSWNFKGSIRANGSGDVIIRSGSAVETTFRSDGYLYAPTWINIGGGGGIFADTNGAHFYPNTYSTYGTWRMNGSRGGWGGLLVRDVANKPHIMYDASGNGGLYTEVNGVWSIFYHVGNDCVAIGGSSTSSEYKARVNGDMRTDGSLEVADSSNSAIIGAASFSWQGNTSFPTIYSSNAQRWVMICNPHVPYLESGTNGYTGATAGSVIGFASNASSSTTYWGLGINPQGIGAQDMFSITRANTTRVLDITSAGNMQITGGFAQNGARKILFPAGGSLEGSSSVTGAIKIALPTSRYGSNTMMTFKVVIYEYSTGKTYEYRIGGYNYSDHAWRNVSCIQISDQATWHQIRWGNDGSRECVWIGETNTNWSYAQIEVMDFTGGFGGESLDGWADGWNLSFVTSFNTVTQTRYPARLGKNIIAETIDLDAGSAYPIEVTSSQRYQIGFKNTSTSEATNHPWLVHEYASKTTGAYSSMIIHFNGIGDKFWFNRLGDLEVDRDIVNNGWYYNRSSVGMYWNNYGYGFRPAHGAGLSYGNIGTYNTGKSGWSGYGIHHSNTAFMGSASGDVGIYNASQGDWAFYYIPTNRGVGLMTSTTSSTYEVYVGGDLYATGDIIAYSDRRVKENIINIDSALDKVKALQGVYYNRINDKDKVREIGFIAQDVHEAVPELASYAEDIDEWGVKYSQVTGLHNEAIKKLASQLEQKDEQIANLQSQIDELKKLILNK
jgi:hypothetical protein